MIKYNNGLTSLISLALLFISINGIGQQAPCVPAPADVTLEVIGEPNNITAPQDQADVYSNGRVVPTIHEMLGVNLLKGNENSFHQMENLTDMFSHARLFQFQNKDYWDDGVGEPHSGDPSSYRIFTPYKDRNRLKLAVDVNGVPLVRNGVQPGDRMVYYDSLTNQMMEEPLLSVYNVYTNYLNQNYHHAVSVYNEFQNPSHISLTVVPANFPQDIQSDYGFPSQWWTASDWGVDYAQRFEAGRAYAMMFARTYAPKASDCATCIKLVEVLEVGNEPWAYDQDVYHAVIDGMIQGIEEYYAADPTNKLLLIPAAYQANHEENNNPVSFNYLDWKDYQGTRIPLDKKCYLHGTNLHPYSNDLADEGTGFYNQRLIAQPEKTSAANVGESKYLYVKNAWKWSEENMPVGSQHLYVSEFGWDSEVPVCDGLNVTGVGEEAQGLYIVRATLMAARNGVHRAEAYEAIDNYASPCDFAYHSSGLWDRLNDGSVAQKQSKETVHKFIELTGNLKFNYSLVETAQDEYAYALEDASGTPVYLVGWLARNVNTLDWTTIDGIIKSNISLNLNFNGNNYEVDLSNDWYYLDNNITTDAGANVTDLFPIADITEVYDAGSETFRFRPVPVLIPIGKVKDDISCSGEITNPSCFMSNDGTIMVDVSAGTAPFSYNWSHDALVNQSNLSDLSPGTYEVEIEDATGLTTSCTFEILPTEQVEIGNILVDNATCGQNNGTLSIIAEPKDGNPNSVLSYSIDNGTSFHASSMFTDLSAGTYQVVVQDADGCGAKAMTQISDESGTTTSIAAACNGTATIDILLTISGGTEPYEVLWEGPTGLMYTTENLMDVPEGMYMLQVTDANDCVTMDVVNLEDCCLTANFCNVASIDPVCEDDLGVISLTSYGGLPPYDFTWSHDMSFEGPIATNLMPGNYTITVVDDNECQAICEVTVEPGEAITIDEIQITASTCQASNGAIRISALPKNGNPSSALQYSIDGGTNFQADGLFEDLPAGSYNLVIRDLDGCSLTDMLMINDEESPTVQLAAACNGTAMIDIVSIVSGGTAPYVFEWLGPDGAMYDSEKLDGVPEGTYMLSLKDANGCQTTAMVTRENCCGIINYCNKAVGQLTCSDDTGTIIYGPVGGVYPFYYEWSHDPDLNGDTALDLPPGNYFVTMTDANGCVAECSASILSVNPITIDELVVTNASCGQTNGSLLINASPKDLNPSSTLSYSIDGGLSFSTTNLFEDLASGNYTIMIQDSDACMTSQMVMLSDEDGPSIDLQAKCDGMGIIIDATLSGGIEPYSFEWTGPGGASYSTKDLMNVPPGEYMLMVKDANGCQASASIIKDDCCDPSKFCELDITQPTCASDLGYASFNPEGGTSPYTYDWSHDATFTSSWADNLASGDYTVTISDESGCMSICMFSINNGADISIEQINNTAATCGASNASITIEATPKDANPNSLLSYSIDNGLSFQSSNMFANVAAGSYTIVVQDMDGCSATEMVLISNEDGPILQMNSTCNGTNIDIDLEITGGTMPYQIEWSGPNGATYSSEDLMDVPVGAYMITVKDANNCQATEFIIQDNCCETSNFCNMIVTQPVCFTDPGSISLSPLGGAAPFDYSWDHDPGLNDMIASNLVAGNYHFTITDNKGCMEACMATIEPVAKINVEDPIITESSCGESNGSLTIVAIPKDGTSTLSYSIDAGLSFQPSPLFENLSAGNYSVVILDSDGCSLAKTVMISDAAGPSITLSSACNGANIDIDAAIVGGVGPYDIEWMGPDNTVYSTEDLVAVPAGNYVLKVVDANDCQAMTSITKDDCCNPSNFCMLSVIQPTCLSDFGAISLNPAGGEAPYSYDWSHDGSFTQASATNLSAGNYTISITDNMGCMSVCSASINSISTINIEQINTTSSSCGASNGSISIQATPKDSDINSMLTYSIDNGVNFQLSGMFANVAQGSYNIIVRDSDACQVTEMVSVSNEDGPVISLDANCLAGGLIEINASLSNGETPYQYEWTGPDGTTFNTEDLSNVVAGLYMLQVTDNNGCLAMSSINKDDCCDPANFCTVSLIQPDCDGGLGSISFSPEGGTAPYGYAWSHDNAITSSSVSDLDAGEYNVTVSDSDGCFSVCTLIMDPAAGLTIDDIEVNPSVCNEDNGSINILATPNNGNDVNTLSYSIDGGLNFSASPLFSNLSVGTYDIVVRDGNGCEERDMILISDAEGPSLSVAQTCVGIDLIDLKVDISGGLTPYEYAWEGPNGFTSVEKDLEEVAAGNYVLKVWDSNDCESMAMVEFIDCCIESDFCNYSIGDLVWKDDNANGVQDPGEQPVEGVEVHLHDCTLGYLSSTFTDTNGNFSFDDLAPALYKLQFEFALPNVGFTYNNQGIDTAIDSDVSGTGWTSCFAIEQENRLDIDAGLIDLGALGGNVWEDMNANGVQDGSEPAIEGIRIELYDDQSMFIGTEYSDAFGAYLFEDLYPAGYYLKFYPSNYELTFPNEAGDDELDSDVDDANGIGTTAITQVVVGYTDLSWDAGFYECVEIGDQVWYDQNGNSLLEAIESGINNVKVEVYYWKDGVFSLWADTFSDVNPETGKDGHWTLCIPPGDFYVQYSAIPDGMVAVKDHFGNDELDSDIDEFNGQNTTQTYTVTSGQTDLSIDAGFFEEARIEGKVWLDENLNGIREIDEPCLSDVGIELYDVDGTWLASLDTDEDGKYSFDNQRCREVYIKVFPPAGYMLTGPNQGLEDTDSDIDQSYGENTSNSFTLESGGLVSNVDIGLLNIVVSTAWQSIEAEYNNEAIDIRWMMTNQLGIVNYYVERSLDGINFTSLSSMDVTELKEYHYKDGEVLMDKTYYYRVKCLKLDGTFSYTDIVNAKTPVGTLAEMIIYPNPSDGVVILAFETKVDVTNINVEIIDNTGSLVQLIQVQETFRAGKQKISLKLDVAPGVYQCLIKAGQQSFIESLIIQNE